MLKRWTALLLAVMLIFLTACGAQKEYKLSAVFAAAEEDRPQWLADPDNAALWEQLGLSGSVVSDGDPAALTIGAQHWVLQPAAVEGRSVTLCYCIDEQNRPLLDLRASFGINVLPVEEWTACENLFIVRVWAQQGGKLPENYLSEEDEGLNRYAVLLTDPITGESASAVASDAELQALLADGEPHALCLRLRAMQQGEPSLRVVTVLCQGWLEKESVLRVQSEQLLWAARHGENDTLRLLLNEGNVSVTDRNGDGLLWAALQSGNAETVELVVKAGATGENHNLYWAEPAALTIAERQDWQQLLSTLEEQHTDTGCTAPSIAYYCTAMGNAERLSLYLAHFPLSAEEAALPEGDSTTAALRYGVESAQTGNLLDLAVANDDTETAAVLLQNGVTASPLLLKKLQASPTTLSDEMLALLGSYRYFGVLDEVLADYRAFKESYEAVAGESCRRFERDYAAYCEAMEKGDSFAAAGIMDSGLLDEIVGQLQAVQNVAKPETEAINALWDLMYEYADMMDTAGYYYKRISLSTYVVTRRYYRALFENRLGRAHALYEEFKHQTAVYDGLLQNWAE